MTNLISAACRGNNMQNVIICLSSSLVLTPKTELCISKWRRGSSRQIELQICLTEPSSLEGVLSCISHKNMYERLLTPYFFLSFLTRRLCSVKVILLCLTSVHAQWLSSLSVAQLATLFCLGFCRTILIKEKASDTEYVLLLCPLISSL